MEWWIYLLIAIAALLVAFIAVILIRTLTFKPAPGVAYKKEEIEFDREAAVNGLAEMVRLRTVSSRNKADEDDGEFDKFEKLLFKLFPTMTKACSFEKVGDRGLLFKWNGKNSEEPVILMSHYDVVSAVETDWQRPAFSGLVEDGVLWGRGTLDTKVTLNSAMQAAENLIKSGFVPEHDVYFAFAGDEEIAGTGAQGIVEVLKKRGVKPYLVLDEGGAVVTGVFPGVKERCALVGIAEKGMVDMEFKVRTNGGHASAPPAKTAIGKLSAACVKVEGKPARYMVSRPAKLMFDTLGRHSSFGIRIVMANMWLFGGVLNAMCKKKGGEMNALLRTTVAYTQMEGSKGSNVLPPEARMVANLRLVGGDTPELARERLIKTINDSAVEVSIIHGMAPSRVSTTECESWEKLSAAIARTWEGALVSPYLMVACSDSRHYGVLSDKVYRFSSMELSTYERSLIHGNDERIPLDTIYKSVEFYIRLLKSC